MVYDEALAARFRNALEGMPGISEKPMMGGICFFLNGNMIGGADRASSGERRFMFRVGRENQPEALTRDGARIVEMGGRRMGGMIFVDQQICDSKTLNEWIFLSLSFVDTLPPK